MPGTPSAGKGNVPVLAVALLLAHALPSIAEILPAGRRTTWNPGIPGGIPSRTTVCATVNASTYGNGTQDATVGIQAAINACPVGQVVQLSAGDFKVDGSNPITIDKGIVLRGAGPSATKLRKVSTTANPLILIGQRWLEEAASVNLTANAAKGATSIQVTNTAGFSVGQLVLVDEITDDSYVYWGTDSAVAPGGPGRGWFTRYDRPVGQMLEIASISGNTVSFTTPLHIAFDTAHTAQLTRYTIPYGARYAGVEDLYVRGGQDDNITVRFAMYSWVKNVESDWSMGDSVGMDLCFRCVLRDSYVHDTPEPFPGGAGYMLSMAEYTADSLVENNIFINGNKVMVMRSTGGGNVVGYNYFDNGYIGNYLGWMETGLNASHMTCPHYELFEGNQAFNIDGDDTWGGAFSNTFFRNHATGKRRSYADLDSRRAIGLMYGHYNYSFVGNVLGTANQSPAPYGSFAYEDNWPWGDDPVPMWRLGYTPTDWNKPAEARVVNTAHRHGNFDYATNTVRWVTGFDQTLPDSLYLTGKPAFFGENPWPWVDATGTTKLHALPARARYDAGTPNPNLSLLTVVKAGLGSGTAFSSPGGIDCGLLCIASYTSGTIVALTATPAAGSTFTGWSGACSGTGTCQVTMSAARTVTATFQPDPGLTINDVTVVEGNAGTTSASFTVTLAPTSLGAVTVNWATANGTAAAPSDYTAGSGSLTFLPTQSTKTVTVLVNGDTAIEPDETFVVNLSGASGASISDAQGQGTITNDDLPALSIDDVTVTEGNAGTVNASFTVTLSSAAGGTVSVNWATANGTAIVPSDYASASGSLTFNPGQTAKTVTVVVNGDTTVEADETFLINLSGASGATIADSQGTGTITNDDSTPPPSGEAVVWTSLVGVTASANDLTKTAAMGWGNGGAVSTKSLTAGDGFVEVTASEANKFRIFGLSNGNSSAHYTDVDFGLYFHGGGLVRVYEAGIYRGDFGTYATGDTLRVAVEGGVVKYKKNGAVFFTSGVTPTYPLLVDAALYDQGATLKSAMISANWTSPPPPPSGEAVVWMSLVGVAASGSDLTKSAVSGWGNAGAVSTKSLSSGDGSVQITASEATTFRIFGLSNGNGNVHYTDVDFGLYLHGGGVIRVYEAGIYRGDFGTYATGDTLQVAVEGGVVKYKRNGATLYTSGMAPTYPLLVDTALYNQGATLQSAVVAGTWTVPPPPPPPAGEAVVWTSLVGVSASGSDLTKSAVTGWNNGGAVSTKTLSSGDGLVAVTASEATTFRVFGLSNGNSNANYTDVDFGLYFHGSGIVRVYEAGVYRGDFGAYASGDAFQVAVEGGVVKYKKNGVTFYTSGVTPAYPLLVDTAFYNQAATLRSAVVSGNWQ